MSTTINIESFSGIMPRVHPTMLPDGCAVKAHNCRLKSGKLSPVRQPSKVTGMKIRLEHGLSKIALAKTIYIWNRGAASEFLAWPGVVKVARGNIADDSMHRIFVTGETGVGGTGKNYPCAYISNESGTTLTRHPLVKSVLAAPTITVSQGTPTANIRYTFFFQTWVDSYGYESGASMPSAEVTYNDGDTITVAAISAPDATAVKRRVYKVVTGTQTESIQFVAEQDRTGNGFIALVETVKDENAGEVIPAIVSPPEDLCWMTYIPGNFYAGFSESKLRTVMFSDVNRPTSWPDAYRYDIRDDLVGLAVAGNTVFALTAGYPWSISGTAPESMTASVMASPQPCVSAMSICVMEGAVFYASQDGICMLSSASSSVQVITEKYFSKREWEALNPSSCIMEAYDGALHCWFKSLAGALQGYIIDVGEGVSAITTHDEQAKAVYYDSVSDGLYFVREG